jgi:Cys-tRNA(Pro)/Cys-tRNA(Cys) deacylase
MPPARGGLPGGRADLSVPWPRGRGGAQIACFNRRMSKTNACRILDSLGISYQLRAYEVDPDDLSAENVASKSGLPPEQVFKTLVVRGTRSGVAVAVIPGSYELDLKALARLMGERNVEMVPLKEVQTLTGYVRGGVTALGMKKDYPAFVDETVELWDEVSVSAGQRGLQILLAPADYLRATDARLAAIAREKR